MSTIDFRTLANRYISDLTPYQPGKPIEAVERELGISSAIKLASNENPLGPSPKAIDAVKQVLHKSHFYPDGACFELKKKLSEFLNVAPSQLTIGNGSENILEIIVKAYLGRHDEAIISQYAFLTISLLIKSYGAKQSVIPANQFGHDIKKMASAVNENTRIIFVVNPNNPTGTFSSKDDLIYLLESIPSHVLVVLDEAYNEYISKKDYVDTLALLSRYPNLVITRTFSKAYGLAALRLGYSVSSVEIADILNRARLPFNVNMLAEVAARAALDDNEHINRSVALNNAGMPQLTDGLTKLKINFIPSFGNFVTFKVDQVATDFYQKLLYEGVIVRPLGAYDMPNYLRVTIGTYEQNEKFLAAMKKIL